MGEASESGEKTHEPTPKKLLDARKDGQVPKSTDLSAAAAYLGLILALVLLGPTLCLEAATKLSHFLSEPETFFSAKGSLSSPSVLGSIASVVSTTLLPFFALPAVAVLLSLIAQNAIVFAPGKLQPKLSKISPITSAKNKFGANGLFEFFKSAAKLIIVSIIMAAFLNANIPLMMRSIDVQPSQMASILGTEILSFLILLFALSLFVGGADYLWQYAEHLRKNRMSRKEIEDESKEAEGDPHNKQARRQRGYEIAMNQMLSEVPDATVVVVNPTHYAVALKWEANSKTVPICVAKGVDEIAARIREIAQNSNIPIFSDPPTARSLFARIEVGQEIWPDDFRAVAAAIRFAQSMNTAAKQNR